MTILKGLLSPQDLKFFDEEKKEDEQVADSSRRSQRPMEDTKEVLLDIRSPYNSNKKLKTFEIDMVEQELAKLE